MKMTMHIDQALLDRVVGKFGFRSKTQAVDAALREMERRARFRDVVSHGIDIPEAELKAAVDPGYDVLELRVAEKGSKYVAGAKPKRPRR